MSLIEELKWRGLLHDIMPGTEELMAQERVATWGSTRLPTACTSATSSPSCCWCTGNVPDTPPLPWWAVPPAWWATPVAKRQTTIPGCGSAGTQPRLSKSAVDEVFGLRRRKCCVRGQQPRLVQRLHVSRLHPRRGQAHHRQLHDVQRQREESPREWHELHRVHVPTGAATIFTTCGKSMG